MLKGGNELQDFSLPSEIKFKTCCSQTCADFLNIVCNCCKSTSKTYSNVMIIKSVILIKTHSWAVFRPYKDVLPDILLGTDSFKRLSSVSLWWKTLNYSYAALLQTQRGLHSTGKQFQILDVPDWKTWLSSYCKWRFSCNFCTTY